MPLLSVVTNYADGTVLTQLQLNQAFESIEDFLNSTKLDAQNIQASAITETELATDAVTTNKISDASITLDKLATEVFNRLMPSGSIIASGSAVTPQGYLYCNGAAVSRTVFQPLFNSIGTAYGNGDASTTFNVPDLRGWFLRGQSDGTGNDPTAAGRVNLLVGGATGDNVGSYQSSANQMHNHGGGAHAHSITDPGHTHIYSRTDAVAAVGLSSGANINLAQPSVATASAVTGISINGSGVILDNNGIAESRPSNAYVRYYIKT